MAKSATPSVPRGPQTGAPPSLEQVSIDRLKVDEAYQRATDGPLSRRIIAGMVREWKWPLCQPLVVSRRADGALYVLDGQHRLAGARARGDLPYLPCVILASLDTTAEARAFVDLNTQRQRLSQADVFNGMLAAGDAEAKLVAELLVETGWRIVRTKSTLRLRPGDLTCAPMLVNAVKWSGRAAVAAALVTLRQAYPDTKVTVAANLLAALVQLFKHDPGQAQRPVSAAIAKRSPRDWTQAGEELVGQDPTLTRIPAIARAIAAAAIADPDAAPPEPQPPKPPRPKAVPAPAPMIDPRFGASGKGWCDQCEALVDRTKAAACASSFCAMKDKAA